MAKLWGGRFSKNTNELVDAFNASIEFDKRLYHEDIRGSIPMRKCWANAVLFLLKMWKRL